MNKVNPILFFTAFTVLFVLSAGCSKSSSPTDFDDSDSSGSGPVVRKPNIYIYPQATSIISIKLQFPLGGKIIQSIPDYNGEWLVEVKPSGLIDSQYDYLFYECQTPDAYQYNAGWWVSRDSLELFFKNNLSVAGFKANEINDFLVYWLPRLSASSHYIIYPQFSMDIEKVIKLKINKKPDKILRLFYVIKGSSDSGVNLPEPFIPDFDRKGFVLAEWGVVLK